MSKRKSNQFKVVLYNDDENTLQYVIDCLTEVCFHNYYQAIQCASLTNSTGKCTIYVDDEITTEDIYVELYKLGLNVEHIAV